MTVMAFEVVDLDVVWQSGQGCCPAPEDCPDHGKCYPLLVEATDDQGRRIDTHVFHVWGSLEPEAASVMAHHHVSQLVDMYATVQGDNA